MVQRDGIVPPGKIHLTVAVAGYPEWSDLNRDDMADTRRRSLGRTSIKETNSAARAALVTKLAGALRLHMQVAGARKALADEEEDEVFPKFRESVSSADLEELGDEVAAAKQANAA